CEAAPGAGQGGEGRPMAVLEGAKPDLRLVLGCMFAVRGHSLEVVALPTAPPSIGSCKLPVECAKEERPALVPGLVAAAETRCGVEWAQDRSKPSQLSAALRDDHADRLIGLEDDRHARSRDLTVHREGR